MSSWWAQAKVAPNNLNSLFICDKRHTQHHGTCQIGAFFIRRSKYEISTFLLTYPANILYFRAWSGLRAFFNLRVAIVIHVTAVTDNWVRKTTGRDLMKTPPKAITTIQAFLAGTAALADIRVTDYSIGTEGKKIVLMAADEFDNVFEAIDGSVSGSGVVTTMTSAGLLSIHVKKDGTIKHGVLVDLTTTEAQALSFGKKLISVQKIGKIKVSDQIRAMAIQFFDGTIGEDTTNGLTVGSKEIKFIASIKIVRHINEIADTEYFADIRLLLERFTDTSGQQAYVDTATLQATMPAG
jgi:hypothetical protein